MGELIPINPNRSTGKEKKVIATALVAVVGSMALGVAGTFGVKDILHRKAIAEGNRKLEPYMQPTLMDIGVMAVKNLHSNPESAKVNEHGEWGEPTITINTKNGKLVVGMDRLKGNLDPNTTNGVEVDLRRPDVLDPGGGAGYEYLFLDYENGQWHADGQVYINPARNQVAFLEVSAEDPNLLNAATIDQKALEMSRQVLGLEVPPHK